MASRYPDAFIWAIALDRVNLLLQIAVSLAGQFPVKSRGFECDRGSKSDRCPQVPPAHDVRHSSPAAPPHC